MKRLIYGVSVVALVLAASFSFVSCNDYVQDQLTELKGNTSTSIAALDAKVEQVIADYKAAIQETENELKLYTDVKDDILLVLMGEMGEAIIDTLSYYVTSENLENALKAYVTREELLDSLASLEALVVANTEDIDSLWTLFARVEALEAAVKTDQSGNIVLSEQMQKAVNAAVTAQINAKVDSIFLASADSAAKADAEWYQKAMDSLNVVIAKAAKVHADAQAIVDSLHQEVLNKIKEHKDEVDAFKEDYNQFASMCRECLGLLQDQIDALTLEVEDLQKLTDNLKGSYDKQITSIVLQGTYNNVFGSINLPFDFQSMILAGHYGQLVKTIDFPEALNGINPENPVFIPSNEVVKEPAGFAYLTINPNTVDIKDVKFTLVNSLDETIGFNIDTVAKSDTKLSFGWTRADNGFYCAAISLDENTDINSVKPRIDFNDIKEVAKAAIKNLRAKKMFDLSSVARVIYENTTDILDATAIKATWEDNFSIKHSVYTNYDMAATVMKPLSYEFEGFDKAAQKAVNKLKQYSLRTLDPFAFDFNINIDSFQLQPLTDSIYPIKITYTDGTEKLIDGFANLKVFIEDLNAYYVGQTEDEVNKLINQIKDQAKSEFNRALGQVNNNYVNRINSYITKFNNYYTKFLNKIGEVDFNHYLQPTMLIGDKASHFGFVSTNAHAPSFVKADQIILTPTSYTAELLAPAYYKYVAVSKVTKGGVSGEPVASALEQCNKAEYNMNVCFQGKQEVLLQLPEKDALYEINYQAVDFSGCTVDGTYYVYAL